MSPGGTHIAMLLYDVGYGARLRLRFLRLEYSMGWLWLPLLRCGFSRFAAISLPSSRMRSEHPREPCLFKVMICCQRICNTKTPHYDEAACIYKRPSFVRA